MHDEQLRFWQHDHSFGQEKKRPGEVRTIIVITITGMMMVVEVAAGIIFGSMALLADGLHMASHAAALSVSAFAYIYARRHAHDERYSFGTGKVNSLGGYTSAVLLAVFALIMVWESVERFIYPIGIAFNQAILVAIVGLIVNGASMLILGHKHESDHAHDEHQDEVEDSQSVSDHDDEHSHYDHNLRAAYVHVLADALTSVLAIFALLAGKYYGLIWMDPLMGIIGAILVARWSMGLLHTTSAVLLDHQGPNDMRKAIRASIESHDDNRVADLHVWSIGPSIYAVELAIVTHTPHSPDRYKGMLPNEMRLAHVNIEVHKRVDEDELDEVQSLRERPG